MPFDVTKPFRARIGTDGDGEPIVGRLTYPPDSVWCDRARKNASVKKIGERGKVDFIDTDTSETDLAIVTKLWLPDSPTSSDAYLAVEILNALDRSEVETDLTERKGDDLVIRMKVYGRDEEQPDGRARVVHTVRQPTKKEVTKFFQNSAHASGKDGKIFTVTSLEPSGKLYAALGGTAEGYAGAIPINHMSAIVLHACLFAANSNSVEDLPPEE